MFEATAAPEIYSLSLHDALPIWRGARRSCARPGSWRDAVRVARPDRGDRKSTRLNSSHSQISYAVFCLKKKTRAFPRGAVTLERARAGGGAGGVGPVRVRCSSEG